jgi:sarcosine oxidase
VGERYDVIVAGLGALGSAAAYHLARGGRRVLGFDRLTPPHSEGSHHGRTRIIREAYFEDPRYVPLVQGAYRLWRALERETGQELLREVGGLMIGVPGGSLVAGARRSADEHGLPYETLAPDEVHRRHPALRLDDGMQALHEPRAGVLFPEACVRAHLDAARAAGARLRFGEPITGWSADARRSLEVERQVLYWLEPAEPAACRPERLPIFLIEHEPERYYYGFPDFGDGVKVAIHHEGQVVDPERVSREVAPDEAALIRDLTRRFLPGASDRIEDAAVCLYTNTPDRNFIVDFHPDHPRVLLASPCSGHGFKFSSMLGSAVADLIEGRPPSVDLAMFRFR